MNPIEPIAGQPAWRAARMASLWNLGLVAALVFLTGLMALFAGPRALWLGAGEIVGSFAGAALAAALLAPAFRKDLPIWNAVLGLVIGASAIAAASTAFHLLNGYLPPVIEPTQPREPDPADHPLALALLFGAWNLPFLVLGMCSGVHIGRRLVDLESPMTAHA